MAPNTPVNKWLQIIEQIKDCEELGQKVDLIGTMLFMVVTNDLACAEVERRELKKQVDELSKKIFLSGIGLAVLILSGLEFKALLSILMKLVG